MKNGGGLGMDARHSQSPLDFFHSLHLIHAPSLTESLDQATAGNTQRLVCEWSHSYHLAEFIATLLTVVATLQLQSSKHNREGNNIILGFHLED